MPMSMLSNVELSIKHCRPIKKKYFEVGHFQTFLCVCVRESLQCGGDVYVGVNTSRGVD